MSRVDVFLPRETTGKMERNKPEPAVRYSEFRQSGLFHALAESMNYMCVLFGACKMPYPFDMPHVLGAFVAAHSWNPQWQQAALSVLEFMDPVKPCFDHRLLLACLLRIVFKGMVHTNL